MEKYIYDEQNGLTYTLVGDYYLPDLLPPQEDVPAYGKYGLLRLKYLKGHNGVLYTSLVTRGRLTEHLISIDHDAMERVERLVELMKVQQGITEELKGRDQMKWVGMMNSIKCAAEDMILEELIFA